MLSNAVTKIEHKFYDAAYIGQEGIENPTTAIGSLWTVYFPDESKQDFHITLLNNHLDKNYKSTIYRIKSYYIQIDELIDNNQTRSYSLCPRKEKGIIYYYLISANGLKKIYISNVIEKKVKQIKEIAKEKLSKRTSISLTKTQNERLAEEKNKLIEKIKKLTLKKSISEKIFHDLFEENLKTYLRNEYDIDILDTRDISFDISDKKDVLTEKTHLIENNHFSLCDVTKEILYDLFCFCCKKKDQAFLQ